MIIVGSKALVQHFNIDREPRDIDIIMYYEEFEQFKRQAWHSYVPLNEKKWVLKRDDVIYEVEIAWPGSSTEIILKQYGHLQYAPPSVLLMLKLSHRYLKDSPHFLKTMRDIQFLRKEGVILNNDLQSILKLREEETYSYEHPKLNRTKDKFFVDSYLFDHDSLHDAVALYSAPAYTHFKSHHAEVMCDMDLFFKCDRSIQLAAVYEEACVLALERSFIPHGKDQDWAFKKALMKVCTSITSGKFREFAWENYDAVLKLKKKVEVPYHQAFFNGIASGVVKLEKSG